MVDHVVYIFTAKAELVRHLRESDSELLPLIQGPSAWHANEAGQHLDDPEVRLQKVKLLYFMYLLDEYPDLAKTLPPGSSISVGTFDRLWDVLRIDVDGDVKDLWEGMRRFDWDLVQLRDGDPLAEWVLKQRRTQSGS